MEPFKIGEDVALKFLQPSLTDRPESYARFTREARTATRIKSQIGRPFRPCWMLSILGV